MRFAVIGIVLGELAILVDLGNRLFGSYARTPLGTTSRILLVALVCLAFLFPLCVFALDPQSRQSRLLLCSFGLLGAIIFLHFLFPYKSGIERIGGLDETDSITPLATGMVLHDAVLDVSFLPKAVERLSLVVLSDLHCNSRRKLGLIRECVARLQRETPDFVVILGDLTEKKSMLPQVLQALQSLQGRYGTFCVRGNHDFEHGREEMIAEFAAKNGIVMLANDVHRVRGISVALAGIEWPWTRGSLPSEVDADLVLGLTHTPDNLLLLRKMGIPLGIAGHTHGGRFTLPFLGSFLVPSKLGRFLDRGWFRLGTSVMYVTSGFGYFPGLLGHCGEVLRLTLRRANGKAE